MSNRPTFSDRNEHIDNGKDIFNGLSLAHQLTLQTRYSMKAPRTVTGLLQGLDEYRSRTENSTGWADALPVLEKLAEAPTPKEQTRTLSDALQAMGVTNLTDEQVGDLHAFLQQQMVQGAGAGLRPY